MRLSAWVIASFLPLPIDPNFMDARSQTDLEQQFVRDIGAAEDKAHQKANWWRNLNRIMSAIGTLLIGVIVRAEHASRVIILLTSYRLPWPSSHQGCRSNVS
jgi:hypothetical protein